MSLFRALILLLYITAPGAVRCNAPLAQATVCKVTFHNPYFVETVTPANPARIRALIEIFKAGSKQNRPKPTQTGKGRR
jgi:hypothetical protein